MNAIISASASASASQTKSVITDNILYGSNQFNVIHIDDRYNKEEADRALVYFSPEHFEVKSVILLPMDSEEARIFLRRQKRDQKMSRLFAKLLAPFRRVHWLFAKMVGRK